MSSSIRRIVLVISALAICLCLSYTTGFGAYRLWNNLQSDSSQPMGVFWEAWDHIDEYFYGEPSSPTERTYGAIHATLSLLNDPYTVFIEPQPRELERDKMRGTFGGIGVALWYNADGQIVLSPYADSPAERAGVRENDILLSADKEYVTDETTLDDVRAWLHGEVNTQVTLTISRPASENAPPTPSLEITITREAILVPSVTWRVLDQAPAIGYIHIDNFTERTESEIIQALQELQEEAIFSIILDLRDNAGGLIDPSVATASQFIREGTVLIERYRDNQERILSAQDGGMATDIPLAVLVNGGTASASEIVAGALQDHNRTPLIGEPTFGKGSVQLIYDLSDGSSLHVTSAIWLTPNQHRLESQGLTPDIYVPHGNGLQDDQLDRAVDYLQTRQ